MENGIKSIYPDFVDEFLKDKCKLEDTSWQSLKISMPMYEKEEVNLSFRCPDDKSLLGILTDADLPWAENHFKERVFGKPANPGFEFQNWPYYSSSKDDNRFRGNESSLFDHTYMERIWCKGYKGIRYQYGDLSDVINKLKSDRTSRQCYLSIWHPEDQSNDKEGKRVPCTLGYWFSIRNNVINVKYLIRSCDIVRHFRNDMYLTGRLLQYVRDQVDTNLQLGEVRSWIGNLHCFESDLYYLRKINK
jgi:hypothetical protein